MGRGAGLLEARAGRVDDSGAEMLHHRRGERLHPTLKPGGDLAGTIGVDVTITSPANSGNAGIVDGHLQNFDVTMADKGGEAVIETSRHHHDDVYEQMLAWWTTP
jgi:hypothetical protein